MERAHVATNALFINQYVNCRSCLNPTPYHFVSIRFAYFDRKKSAFEVLYAVIKILTILKWLKRDTYGITLFICVEYFLNFTFIVVG